jgi:hypothetical protein
MIETKTSMRSALAVGCLAVVLVGCGGGGVSLTEYAETLEALAFDASGQLEAGDARMSIGTPTIETAREVLTQALAVRAEFQEGLTALDPPEEIADIHAGLVDLHARILTAQEVFAARAETATGIEELDESVEAQAYRAMQTDVSLCQELQARIDATATHAAFTDVPWIPGDLKEVVEVTLWC